VSAPLAPAQSNVAAVSPAIASVPASQPDVETQRLRAEAETLKKQAGAELARARSDADAVRAAKAKAEADAAANRSRAQSEADAARIRGAAGATASLAKGDPPALAANAQVASSPQARNAESRPGDAGAVTATASTTADKTVRAPASAAADGARYDGSWSATVVCAPSEGAASYKLDFNAQVKDNFLRGEQGVEGRPGWMRLQGPIQPDGSATLDAQGLTGDPKYNVKGVGQGMPYSYHVAAHFDANRGTGRRLELRACDLRFAKQ
jgi:hypothetical protein